MNHTPDTPPNSDAETSRPMPSIWTVVWPLLGSIAAFAAAYLAFNRSSYTLWAAAAAGVFMLLAHMSKPKAE
jgi:hypothetical protein